MILLMNNEKIPNTVKETTEKAIKIHLLPYIQTYKEIVGYTNDYLAYVDQMATYHGDLLFTNFKVNIQEHFVKMVNKFIRTLIFKRRPGDSDLKTYQGIYRMLSKVFLQTTPMIYRQIGLTGLKSWDQNRICQ